MPLSVRRYRVNLCVQFGFLLVDFLINSFGKFAPQGGVVLLVIYILQVVCLIFSVIVLVLSFFSTYAFQAGLTGRLYQRFGPTLCVSACYLLLTVGLDVWLLSACWDAPHAFCWPAGLLPLFVAHRLVSVLHYYMYKRSSLVIADPSLYQDFDW
ncbi:transmembrane protein 138 [Bacillus rossius redtenbacheri]|uniref:transmembrane protein 138 n=1 Tax=Bacillus rossius redtenbacheri TaxID=93214 RepID=UPI002FDD869E